MRINQAGLHLIKSFESCRLTAYPDPATGGDPWTIGFGHTGPDVKKGKTITLPEAEALLVRDVEKVEEGVLKLVRVPLTENQFAALVSFAFNVGLGNLAKSTLLRLVNERRFDLAAGQFASWVFANKRKMNGLVKRRAAEQQLFSQPE